jgi:hypothetical protein
MQQLIQNVNEFLDAKGHQGPFILFVPWKVRRRYLKMLLGVKGEELDFILANAKLVSGVHGWPTVRAEIINYEGREYAIIDPERIHKKYLVSNEIYIS